MLIGSAGSEKTGGEERHMLTAKELRIIVKN